MDLNYIYLAFNVHPNQLKEAVSGFKALGLAGINVTIPHKERVMKFLDEIEPLAEKIGAVNAIKNKEGYLIGKNTDSSGALKSLKDFGFHIQNKKVLVLGAGGASKAITFSLANEIKELVIANRNLNRARDLAQNLFSETDLDTRVISYKESILQKELADTDLLINTTPIGMAPNINQSPIDIKLLHESLEVFDIIYNPIQTKLIKNADKVGCKTLGGLDMLVNQGALAFEWWTNEIPDTNLMKEVVIKFLRLK